MSSKSKPIVIDLNINGSVTSISCGHIIVELIKFLAYQRLQIPYTYQWLKQIVSKRKLTEEELKPLSFQSESHFHTVSASLDNLDFILKSISQEVNGCSMPQEVCIALGGTPVAFKEVYRLLLPADCHKPQCHSPQIATDQKIQRNIFRALVTSEKLSELFTSPLPPTNLHVLVKKKLYNSNINSNDNFMPTNGYWIPRTSKVVVINFNSPNNMPISCCNEIKVFGDVREDFEKLKIDESNKNVDQYYEIESTDNEKWFQSTYVMKGFKDCFINGSSVMNSWTD